MLPLNLLSLRALLAVILATASLGASAQDYPSRPIRLLLSVPGGSSTDVAYRIVTGKLTERLGWNFVVDNRPGGDHVIAMNAAAQSAPDGYTLLGYMSAAPVIQNTKKDLPFNVVRDFTPIVRYSTIETAVFVTPDVPAKTFGEFVAYSKANPGKLNWTAGVQGAPVHIFAEQIKLLTGFTGPHIPYKSTINAVTDMLGGSVQVGFMSIGNAIAHVRSGKLRPILALQPKRSSLLPDTQSTAEAGMAQIDAAGWFAFAGPANLPRQLVDRLQREIVAAIQLPDAREAFAKIGVSPVVETTDEMTRRIRDEIQLIGNTMRDAKIQIE